MHRFLLALLIVGSVTLCSDRCGFVPVSQAAPVGTAADWDATLKKYVKGDYFDYAGLHANAADKDRFDAFLAWQAQADVKKMSREEAIAFYINAYNSCCIAGVLNHYPVHSPMDIPGYFDKLTYRVAGEDLTVSQIEYDRLIANYKDMRAHFAVVCSDRGCLPIKGSAWTGSTLDADLDAAANRFVNDPRHLKIDSAKKEIWLSKIFEWYGPKFTNDPTRPAEKPEQFLKYWAPDDVKAMLDSGEYTLRTIEWDWTLNEKLGS